MQEWINRVLETPEMGPIMLLAILLLGILSSVVSGCNVAVIGALAGYGGTRGNKKYRDILVVTISFMLGTILALAAVGAVIGYAGQVAGESFGRYSRLLTGLVLVFFGLMALGLVPLNKLPKFSHAKRKYPEGMFGAIILGFTLGGASITCSISCYSPALAVVLGVASLQGQVAKSTLLVGTYAAGYSMPLAAILLGVSFGKWTLRASKAMPVIKVTAGILLLLAGFYFLITI